MRVSGWYSRRTLRVRLMTIGLVGIIGALLLGGGVLYAATGAALDRAVRAEARSSAQDVAVLVNDGRLPDPVPVSGAQLVQVLDAQNRVLSGSVAADRLTPVVTPQERPRVLRGDPVRVPGSRAGVSGPLEVAGVAAGPSDAPVLVVAAVPTADLETSRRVVRTLLLVAFPAFLLVIAAIAWRVIGSALRPVEALRRGAERIGEAADPGERLPVPPTRDEVQALATTLNGMLARLADASARQRAFVADAAHELRSPLATMRTQLEVAQRLGEGNGLAADLLPEVERLGRIVDDLLVLARAGAPSPSRRLEPVDLGSLAAGVVARYAVARVPVTVRAGDGAEATGPPQGAGPVGGAGPVVMRGRPEELDRALSALLDNAVRHAASGVVVEVSRHPAKDGPDVAQVTVSDDGSGIPEADRERVFDRFARLDDARDRDSGGSGLGLAIVRELVGRHGGSVRLEDAGPGTRAVVLLPLERAGQDHGDVGAGRLSPGPAGSAG
ncbi:ATP-binding protein [Phycicoccus sp. M110.8]|uniref:sensor histidine kinase n=1 Tax=Phycicoccus sp. M110.8 TaxID=3075433 RepID=UPI0028FCFDF2|nr:ATP-binding protein [Phycicoccus sp. M110.8]MDU0313926.1 ATP-binding protein [Phycicoccus sp. M110.8]